MPLGSYRLNGLGKGISAPSFTRTAKFLEGIGSAKISTTQSKFGGSSFQLNGYPDSIMALSPDFAFTGDFTVECWMYFTSHENYGGIISYATESGSFGKGYNIVFNGTTNAVGFEIEGQSSFYPSSTTISANAWNHIALVRNGSSVILYLNGVNSSSATSAVSLSVEPFNLLVGMERGYGSRTLGYFDEIRLSKVARYTGNFTPSASAFTKDSDTVLLLHADGSNKDKSFVDDADTAASVHTVNCFKGSLTTADKKFGATSFYSNNSGSMACQKISAFGREDNWTVEGWFKLSSLSPVNTLFMLGNEFYNRYVIYVDTSGYVKADKYSTGAGNFTSSVTLSTNTWYHIAFVKNGTTGTLYINGVSRATTSTIGNETTGGIGFRDTIFRVGYGLNGYADEIRLSSSARYTSGFTPSTSAFTSDSNTILLWHCDGDEGATSFTDSSTYDPYEQTTKTLTAMGNAAITTAQSKFGGASAYFDGTGDKVYTNSSPNFILDGDFTIEFWTRSVNNTPQYNSIVSSFGSAGNFQYAGYWAIRNRFNNVNQLAMTIRTNSTWVDITTNFAITAASPSWIHVAAVRNGNTITLYANGVSKGSTTLTHPLGLDHEKVVLGGYGGNGSNAISGEGYYTGWLDEVRISKVARYTSNFTAPTTAFTNDADTVLLVHCNGTNGSTSFTDDNS